MERDRYNVTHASDFLKPRFRPLFTSSPEVDKSKHNNQSQITYPPSVPISSPPCLNSLADDINASSLNVNHLKPVSAVPEKYRQIFSGFPFFNFIQSKVFDDAIYNDKSIVVSAPTGSGKTVIFELAIIRLLMKYSITETNQVKAVYMAPVKALCAEKFKEWQEKFSYLGLTIAELTGDTEGNEYLLVQNADIILTTPEKWDKLTRGWRNNEILIDQIKLFLIDEVHLLNCNTRGPTLEAVVSRMKMLQTTCRNKIHDKLRFMAVSATIPNADDIAQWLGYEKMPAICVQIGDEMRPVKLKKFVLVYPCPDSWTQFRFDINLSYKLANVIFTYSEGKPTLIFCSTRSGVIETARVLGRSLADQNSVQDKQKWLSIANSVKDMKLKEALKTGIGFHHAGLHVSDRQQIEGLFISGELLILVATSTLAMGVNLPAHLVIIKSTFQYHGGTVCEYTESEILQMIGRAGRPQFDTSATAVIMTKPGLKAKYQSLIGGTQLVESHFHKHLIEHLNAEVVLRTISDVGVLSIWIQSTFLYVRVLKNPQLYGMKGDAIESSLLDICIKNVNTLVQYNIISTSKDGFELKPTQSGRLMARYYLAFDTMKLFMKLSSEATLNDLIIILSSCKEFADVILRTSEKKTLNSLNKDKVKSGIRFPMSGKIKTREMKVNCLIQANLGNLTIPDPGLNQDILKIMRNGQRISRCLADYVLATCDDYKLCLNAVVLSKCLRAQLWENSFLVAKQLDKIGTVMATSLMNAGLTNFKKIEQTNPRELEMIVNRHPPFGNQILKSVTNIPKYQVEIEEGSRKSDRFASIAIKVTLSNWQILYDNGKASNANCFILIGNADNKIIIKQKLLKNVFQQSGQWTRKIEVEKPKTGNQILINLINEEFVGVDINTTYNLGFPQNADREFQISINSAKRPTEIKPQCLSDSPIFVDLTNSPTTNRRKCNHSCANKSSCRHLCCKDGVQVKSAAKRKISKEETLSSKQTRIELVDTFHENVPNFVLATPKRLSLKSAFEQPSDLNSGIISEGHFAEDPFSEVASYEMDELDFEIFEDPEGFIYPSDPNPKEKETETEDFQTRNETFPQPNFNLNFDYTNMFSSSENESQETQANTMKLAQSSDNLKSPVKLDTQVSLNSMFATADIDTGKENEKNVSVFYDVFGWLK